MRRLRPGMTLAEVEALLGGPAAVTVDRHPAAPDEKRGYRWLRRWKAEGAAVDVQFTAYGLITAVGGRGRSPPGPLAPLRPLLGWGQGGFRFLPGGYVSCQHTVAKPAHSLARGRVKFGAGGFTSWGN